MFVLHPSYPCWGLYWDLQGFQCQGWDPFTNIFSWAPQQHKPHFADCLASTVNFCTYHSKVSFWGALLRLMGSLPASSRITSSLRIVCYARKHLGKVIWTFCLQMIIEDANFSLSGHLIPWLPLASPLGFLDGSWMLPGFFLSVIWVALDFLWVTPGSGGHVGNMIYMCTPLPGLGNL